MTKLFEEIDEKIIIHTVVDNSSIKAVESEDDEQEVFKIVISTNKVDRYGEIVNQEGINIENYMKNPIVLWGHDYYLPPIGKTIELVMQKTKTIAKFIFADTPFAQEIKSLVKGGFVNMSSIGFISHDYDRDKRIHNESEMLEFSLVDVPANPGAAMQRSLMIKSFAQGIKELECKEMEAYVCKKGDTGCKICSKIIEEIKKIELKGEETPEIKPEIDDLSNNEEENNKDIKEEIKVGTEEDNKEVEKLFYQCVDKELDTSFLEELETPIENISKKITGEEEITPEEKGLIDIIFEMGLLLKKKNGIIEETNQELSKAEKPLKEKINQLDNKIKEILHEDKAKEEEDDQTKQLIKISSKALNLVLSKINNKK